MLIFLLLSGCHRLRRFGYFYWRGLAQIRQAVVCSVNKCMGIFCGVDLLDRAACVAHNFDHVAHKAGVAIPGYAATLTIPERNQTYLVYASDKR